MVENRWELGGGLWISVRNVKKSKEIKGNGGSHGHFWGPLDFLLFHRLSRFFTVVIEMWSKTVGIRGGGGPRGPLDFLRNMV